jgi:hypothetical protein
MSGETEEESCLESLQAPSISLEISESFRWKANFVKGYKNCGL